MQAKSDDLNSINSNEDSSETNVKCKLFDFISLNNTIHITILNLSEYALKELPVEIGNMINLKRLDLSRNNLITLPNSLKSLHQLTSLNVSFNQLCGVPQVFYFGLRNLQILDLSFNEITKFDEIPLCSGNLSVLKLSFNNLDQIPKWIFSSICNLRVLELNGNYFYMHNIFSDHVYGCGIYTSLLSLNLENCGLSNEKFSFISYLKNLQHLHIGNSNKTMYKNYLGNLNYELFKNCSNLTNLSLQNVQISLLPVNFSNFLTHLMILNLSSNMLSWLPENFSNLHLLVILNLNFNQLLFLPEGIGRLTNLQQLHLSNNKLIKFPTSFSLLNNLTWLDLYDNDVEVMNGFSMEKNNLKGLDLELNYLTKYMNELDSEQKNRYNSMKMAFRQQFNLVGDRSDGQKIKSNQNDDIMQTLCESSDQSEFDDENSQQENSNSKYVHKADVKAKGSDEDWDLDAQCVENDDLFDPNKIFYSRPPQPPVCFLDNFCPAKSHMNSSISYFFKRKSSMDLVDGQFDSD